MVKSRAKANQAKTNQDEASHETAAEESQELHLEADSEEIPESSEESQLVATVATVGVVAIGVAVVEAELLPGVILGVAAMAVPKVAPKLGSALAPMFKHAVRGVYRLSQKTKELVAETHERVQDIVAEIEAEGQKDAPAKEPGPTLK
jgi:hypothetical protein